MKLQKRITNIGVALSFVLATGDATAFDPLNPIPDPIAKGSIVIELESIASATSPNWLTHAGDGTDRLFVVEQPGQISIISAGTKLATPFLDVSNRLPPLGVFGGTFDERGLLGLAFHPDFVNNGKLYTFTSEPISAPADFAQPPVDALSHQSVIAEWTVDPADANRVNASSRKELIRIDNPQFNHNGGGLNFGHDNMLYVSIGDGGNRDDVGPGHSVGGNGQDTSNVLGSILRIDVDGNNSVNGKYGIPGDNPFTLDATTPDEIFAVGFRNPFRFSFDSENGDLIVGDVGQGSIEEVDIVTAGRNYGWNAKEGSFAFTPQAIPGVGASTVSDDLSGVPLGLVDPVLEYDHDEGISVIGGFVYHGQAIPELDGKYVFGDFTLGFGVPGGRLFYGDLDTGLIQEFVIGLGDRALGFFVKGFGQDAAGEIYVLVDRSFGANSNLGEVLKIVAAPVPVPAAVWLFGSAIAALGARRRRKS